MPNARGPLNLVRQARRGFSAGTGQDVRYWTLGELRETFGAIGPVSLTADGFLTINPQTADLDLLPARSQAGRARLRRCCAERRCTLPSSSRSPTASSCTRRRPT